MNNFMIGLKRFFTNKNVVTIILVLVILVVLYFGYSSSIKSQTNPVSVPVAKEQIGQLTEITADMIEYNNVPGSMLNEDVVRSSALVIGKYTNINVTVPKGSVFYSSWLLDKEDVPGNWIEELDYEKGELGYYMSIDVESTLGNSVLPNTYIDMYMKAEDENGTIIFGKLMKNVKVLVVHDSNGNNAFNNTTDGVSASKIGFAVSQDMYILLKKAEYLGIDLVIAPRGSTVPSEDYIIVTSSVLRDYIDAKTITAEEDLVAEIEDEATEETEDADKEDTTNNSTTNNNSTKVE